jgi:hypothetical protein
MLMAKLAKHFRAVVGMFDSTLHKTTDEMSIAKDSPLINFVQLWETGIKRIRSGVILSSEVVSS